MNDRRVYTPDLDYDDDLSDFEDGGSRKLMLGAVMAVIVVALGVVAWNTYGRSGEPPLLTVENASFKTAAPADAVPAAPDREIYDAIEGEPQPLTTRDVTEGAPAAPRAPSAPAAPVAVIAPAAPGAQGAFLVQLGALRSRTQAEEAWGLFSARAPSLARSAHMDVQRADLGAQGIFYRLRAGYFDTREKASSYCERAKTQGQECMVVVR